MTQFHRCTPADGRGNTIIIPSVSAGSAMSTPSWHPLSVLVLCTSRSNRQREAVSGLARCRGGNFFCARQGSLQAIRVSVLYVHELAQTVVSCRFREGRLGSERVIMIMGRPLLSA